MPAIPGVIADGHYRRNSGVPTFEGRLTAFHRLSHFLGVPFALEVCI